MNRYHVTAHIRADVQVEAPTLRDALDQINHIPVREWDDPDGLYPPIEPESVYIKCPGCDEREWLNVLQEDHCERCGTCDEHCEGWHR